MNYTSQNNSKIRNINPQFEFPAIRACPFLNSWGNSLHYLSECGLFSDCVEVSPLLQTVQVHLVGQQLDLGQAVKQGQPAHL